MNYKNKKVLVTGANGQLGNEIKKLSSKLNLFEFTFTDIEELDITDKRACRKYVKDIDPFFIINCAAYTAVDKAETDKELAWKLNVGAVKNLVEASEMNDSYFIQISTDYVFDGKACVPYTELDIPSPQSEYGRSKLAGEDEALKYLNSIVIRTSWLYSTFGNNFAKTMVRLGTEKDSLKVVFDQVGTPTYAEDLAAAILQIIVKITNKKRFTGGIFHYSNEGVCSWYDFACAIMKITGVQCTISPIETKEYRTLAQRPSFSVLNKTKIKKTYGIEISHWQSSLERMLKALFSNASSTAVLPQK